MEKDKKQSGIFRNLQCVIVMALFTALGIVLGKYLSVTIPPNFRISLENTPAILAALTYGPIAGMVVGGLADVLGSLMVGYTINPIITAGAMLIGLSAGIFGKLLLKDNITLTKIGGYLRCLLTVSAAHLIGSVIVKTYGLYLYYGSPFFPTLLARLGIYTVTAVAEAVIIDVLYTNKIIAKFKRPCRS